MIVELRKMRKENRSKMQYISNLLNAGKIPNHMNETNGYMSYDTEELEEYQKNVKWGRPVKKRVKQLKDFTLGEVKSNLDGNLSDLFDSSDSFRFIVDLLHKIDLEKEIELK